MLKVLEEKVIEKYLSCVKEKESILEQCRVDAENIGSERHYSEETIEKLYKFIVVNTRQEDVNAIDREIDFWSEFVVDVEEVVEEKEKPAVESDFVSETVADAFEKETAAEELVEKEVEPVEETKVEVGTIGVIE